MKQVIDGRVMGRPHQSLVFLGQVSRKEFGAVRKHPGTPVGDLHARENVRRIFVELILDGLAGIRSDRRDVDQADDPLVDTRGRDGGAAIRVPHEEDGAADAIERALDGGDVLHERVQAILDRDHFMPIGLQCGDHLAEA